MFILDSSILPCTDLEEHRIDTGDAPPIYIPPYRCSQAEEEVIQKEADEMLALGIIRESRSPWGASAVLVTKKTGDWRLCVDYRALNRVTKKESYPIPLIDDMLNAVGRSSWFTLIDLRSAYWQIPMERTSICKTAFSTQKGHYEFLRMPFGLVWAVLRFQGFTDKVLKSISDICRAYLDDFLTHATSFEGACQGLEKVLTVLRDAKLTVSFSKCRFLMRETPYLGFLLTRDGVKIDPVKTDAIRKLQVPTDVASLQHLLGLYQHYARFHPGFAEVAVPLTDLTQKNRLWNWTASCPRAFETIKANLVAEPILLKPDFSKPFIIQTDWSPTALGAVLAQVHVHPVTGESYEAAVYFASKKLKGAELHYSATEGECQAVLWAVKLFRPYVYGSLFEQTDHCALKWLMTCRDLQGKLARWSLKLQAYNMVVVHKRGWLHRNVDALSRVEICPAKYMSELASTLYEMSSESEADEFLTSGTEDESEDSMEELTEAERVQFLEARDLFVNAECRRLALLETDDETGTSVAGQILYVGDGEDSYAKDANPEEEWAGYVPDPEEGWLEAAELLGVEEEEDSLQEPD